MVDSNVLLKIENLRTAFQTDYGFLYAVDGVSFHVNNGEILAIVGESGSGKSVTCLSILNLVGGKEVKISGSIKLSDRELVGLSEKEMRDIRGKDIGMIFQEPMTSLNPVFTVGQQIDETIRAHQNMSKPERKERIIDLLSLVGIPEPRDRINCYPHELSGGMKQRVMIAMALACNPKMLIADEPTTALDVTIQAQVLALLKELRDKIGMSIAIVTHDLGVVSQFAERVVVMYAGRIVEEGKTKDVLNRPYHSYTKGLIASIPKISSDPEKELSFIPGMVPDLSKMPEGCRFSTRCSNANDRCFEKVPPFTNISYEHRVSCWRYVEGGI